MIGSKVQTVTPTHTRYSLADCIVAAAQDARSRENDTTEMMIPRVCYMSSIATLNISVTLCSPFGLCNE